jgi:hypothetical protein
MARRIKKELITVDSDIEEDTVDVFFKDGVQQFELEGNKLSFTDLKVIFPTIYGLNLEVQPSKFRMIKPVNGYFSPPKTGWRSVKVFVLLHEIIGMHFLILFILYFLFIFFRFS